MNSTYYDMTGACMLVWDEQKACIQGSVFVFNLMELMNQVFLNLRMFILCHLYMRNNSFTVYIINSISFDMAKAKL
jgi:hypothetical protein